MRKQPLVYRFAMPAVLLLVFSHQATGASVTGHVRDKVSQATVAGAKVQLRNKSGNLSDPVLTNTDGQYDVKMVDDGEYVVVVNKVGFIPRPCADVRVKVHNQVTANDVLLTQLTESAAYYVAYGGVLLKAVGNASPKEGARVLRVEWEDLGAMRLPPSCKAIVARTISSKAPFVKEITPEIEAYAKAAPESIKKAQEMFEKAIGSQGEVPSEAAMKGLGLDATLVADLMLYAANDPSQSDQRPQFIEQFRGKWENTLALTRFDEIRKRRGSADDLKDDYRVALNGVWVPVSASLDGKAMSAEEASNMRLVFQKGKYFSKLGDTTDEGTYTIDESTDPKKLTIVGTKGPNKGRSILAIFNLDKNTLKVCYDLSGKSIPEKFESNPDSHSFLVTYERQPRKRLKKTIEK
jgi:uncharacterized protein (TIGR03067 family)